jgi:hypothetical protein
VEGPSLSFPRCLAVVLYAPGHPPTFPKDNVHPADVKCATMAGVEEAGRTKDLETDPRHNSEHFASWRRHPSWLWLVFTHLFLSILSPCVLSARGSWIVHLTLTSVSSHVSVPPLHVRLRATSWGCSESWKGLCFDRPCSVVPCYPVCLDKLIYLLGSSAMMYISDDLNIVPPRLRFRYLRLWSLRIHYVTALRLFFLLCPSSVAHSSSHMDESRPSIGRHALFPQPCHGVIQRARNRVQRDYFLRE